ncbi:hypothetical protein [Brucella gallinifaecis]|uniref:hypothetical protein n=1 Tax=Brucella gallinifaecis TaxID=215590 RepID=UPI002362F21C|nr:hypothetical protein [Brucella gallinifaecis]
MIKYINGPHATEAEVYSDTAWNVVCNLDPWVASSLLQKAIRRSEVGLAVAAGLRLHQLRGAAIWSRLLLITVEDIGIASPTTLSLVVKIARMTRREPKGDFIGALAHVIETLALAPKCRCSDYLVCAARYHPSFEADLCLVGKQTKDDRIRMAVSPSLPIVTRAIAAWFTSGLNWSGESRVGEGDLPQLLDAFASTGRVPEAFLSDVTYACERTKHPIAIMLPVLWAAAHSPDNSIWPHTTDLALPASPTIRGVPAYAYDKHTYAGKAAIGRLAIENDHIAAVLNKWVADFRAVDATAMAAFYVDAIPVRPQFIWQGSADLERLGREADFLKIEFPAEGIEELIKAVSDNIDHLNDLRAKRLLSQTSKGKRRDA